MSSSDTTPLQELQQWARSDRDISMMVVGFLKRTDANSLADLHDRFFDAFADLYDACADLLAQSPTPNGTRMM